jgi:hypothetical protein
MQRATKETVVGKAELEEALSSLRARKRALKDVLWI